MKKLIIGALVGGLILFIWQFVSWAGAQLHADYMSYTPNQDKVMEALAEHLEPGNYMLPSMPADASPEMQQEYMDKYLGKPWAMVQYHESMDFNMGLNMARGFIVDVIAIFLLCWLFSKFESLDMKTTLLSSIAVGLIGYFTINYINQIWFDVSSLMDLVDAIVGFGLVGLWLGWFLNR